VLQFTVAMKQYYTFTIKLLEAKEPVIKVYKNVVSYEELKFFFFLSFEKKLSDPDVESPGNAIIYSIYIPLNQILFIEREEEIIFETKKEREALVMSKGLL
jgi:hypothetical protein